MSNLFDRVNVNFGISTAEQPDEKIPKKVTLSYGQASAPQVTSGSAVSVNHVVVCCPDKSDSSVAVTRNESEQVNEIDILKQFTIPKKRKAKKELLESIRLDSREFQHDVLPVIQQSFKCHNARNNFTFLQARLVHNTQLFSQFVERRKQMRLEGYSDKDAQDSYAFLCVESEVQARKICKHGLYIGHSSLTCLGNPQMGLYLSRHADIVRACPFHPGFSAILIIFKIIKGKLKLMAESASNVALDPTPNYDCHMSKAVTGDVFSMTPQQAFEATQMYLYEYGDLDLEERPRQICPYAMVHFCHSGEQQVYRRPTLPSQHASKPSQRAATVQKSPQSAGLQRPPYLQRQQSAPQHTPQHTPVSPTCIPSDPTMPVLTAESERGNGVAPSEPRQMSEGGTPTEPCRVGEEADGGGGGVIVWKGEVTTRGCVLCNAELVSYSSGVKPARIGQELPLDCGQPLVKVKDKYFGHMITLDKQEVVTMDNKYYSYCELRPTRTTQGKFNQIMTFLAKRQIGIIIKLPDNVHMVMLTNSEITQSLGLSEAHSNPLLLHCVFISPASRYTQLQGKLGSQPQHTDEVPRLNPPAQIHDKEPSNQNRFTSRSTPNLLHESRLDEDFRKFVPLSSLVYHNSLSIDFEIQANVQDQHNINIARGIITPNRQPGQGDGALHHGVPPSVTAVERGFGMDKHPSMPQSSPTSSHSMPELVGSIHCHQLSPAQPSHAPMPRHHSHSFDQSPVDIEPEFAACRSQCSDPTMAYGQSSMAYGRPHVNLGYGATMQHHRHSSQGYDDQHGAAHVLLSPPVPQPQQQLQQHPQPQQHPHWPSTQTLTYPQTCYARPVSAPIHTPPNIPRQVSDPRLLRNRRPSADVMQSAPVTSTAMFGAAGANAAMTTTIQNQNLAECLSVGPSPTTGTSVQRHLVSTSPLLTGRSTGRICGTASMAEPPTERHITGDDKHVNTALRTGSPDGVVAGASASRSDVVAAVGSSTDVRTASAPTPVELFAPPSGIQSSYKMNTSLMDVDEMSDDLVDQIVRGCVMAARLKPSVTSSTDSYPASASLDAHPATTVVPPVDSVTSQQLSKTSHKILEEMAKIKMLQEVKAAAEKLSQNAAAAATIPTTSPATSSVPIPPFAFVSAAMLTGEALPPLVAAHTTNTTTTETTTLIQTPQKSESGTHQQRRVLKQTVTVKKPHVGTKEKAKEKETPGKRKKSTSVIRTANDMKLFLNANKGHKRDGRVTKRTVTQKKTDPRLAKRAGVKKSRMEHRKQTPLSNISQTAQSLHRGNAIDDITVTFTRDSGDLADDLGDKLEKDEMLERCLFEAMHRYESDESEPETEAEMEMTDLWHISLHYLLPIIDWLQLHDREVMEDEGKEEGKENTAPSPESSQRPETSTATAASAEATAAVTATTAAAMEASVSSPSVTSSTAVTTPMAVVIMPTLPARHNQSAAAGGKSTTSSGMSTSDRFHPYRRPSRQSLAIQERLTSYSDARDLEELMRCLTSPCYRGRRKQLGRFAPLLDLFARPQLFSAGRFDTYNYCPNMLDTSRDVAATDDREVEMRDVPYKAEEIPDYNERKVKASILDKHISSSVPCNAQQVAALNTEQQFYPYELAGNTVEVQSGKLGGITDGPMATTRTTMANVAHARRSTPPTRLAHCCGKSDRKTWKRVGVETMVKSQESSEATEMFGGGHTPWPGLKTEVDVCLSASRHRRNPCQVDLPQLVDAQVVTSRDPRLSANLCSSSIYLRTCSVDKSCDSSKDSFTSEDWSCKDGRERVELVTEAKMIKVKVLVNPKYIADTCKIDLFDSVQKIVCSKDMCSGGRKVTTDTANDSSKQKNATANGHRDCNSKTKPIEAAQITTEQDLRKNQQQHPTAASLQRCGKDTQQNVSSDGKQHTPTVKHPDEQKKHHSKSDVKTSKHKDTSGKKIHRNKQLEHKLAAAEFGSDANPNGGRSCHKCPVINSDKEPGHVSELPTRTLRQQRTAQQDHSTQKSTDPDESEGGSKGHSNKTLLPKGKKMPVSQCTVNSREISVQIDHAMDKDLVLTKKDCQKICVKPHLDKQLPCSNDKEDVCRANSEQQVHSVGNRPSSPENIRSIKTSCDARVQPERAVCERGAEHSRCKRQPPLVPLSTPGDSNISGYMRNKTTNEASVMSEDYRSVVIKRRSGCHVKKRQRAKVSVDDDKTDQQVRSSSREASRELSPPAMDWHATNCVDQRTDRENTTARRCSCWHTTVEHLNPLSGFVEDCLYKQPNYSQQRWTNNIMKFQLRKVLSDMERVYQGRDVCSVRVLTPIKHLSVLSLPTELEASYIESPFVRTLHLQALREWMAKKPLDMLLLGKGQPLNQPLWSLPATSQTDNTVTGCSVEFFDDMFHLLRGGRCGSDDMQDLYPEPCSATQETVHQVFRQVRHYMEFLAKKQSSDDRQASQNKSRLVSCRTDKSTHHRTDEGRTDVHESRDGTEGIWEIPLEPEYEYLQHDPRKRGKTLKSIDNSINGMLDEFYGDVDELLDANCLSSLSQQRSQQKLIANRLPKCPHITKHLMKMLMVLNRDKHSAASSRANEKPVNGVLENDTADAGADLVLYSPTQPTGFDDSGLIQPDVKSKAKMAKRKTRACTDHSKCKKRRTKTTSGEDTHVRVDRRSITGNKRRYSDALSEEIIHLNMEENTLPIEQKQNATSDAHGKADSFIATRQCADESRRKTTDFVTACRMSFVKNETHNSQMRRFRRQLQSRRTCFLDSYLSSSGDALGDTPVSNFDSSFDQTCSSHEANCNPYVLTGPMLQYFLEPHETRLTSHVGKFCPSPTQFTTSKLEPENSFMWSLALNNVKPKIESPEKPSVVSEDAPNNNRHELAVEVCDIRESTIEDHDSIEPTVEDRDSHDPEVEDCDYHESAAGNDDSHEPTMEDHHSHDQTVENHDRHELAVEGQTQTENVTDLAATLLAYHGTSPSKKLAPIKQGNRLMQAFRQAVEAKKRAKTNTKAAARVLMKVDPEKRPYPKAAVTLFKPPIAFTLMQKSRIATLRPEAVTANIEHAAPTKEKDENRFVVTLLDLSQVNSVTQESFSSISHQLEDALTEDFSSPAVNGIVHQEPDVLQHGLTVRHLSSLSATTKRIYRTNRSRVSRFSLPVMETAASQPTPYSIHTPTPCPVYSFALKKKLKCDTPKKESTVALSFDMAEDHDKCSDEPEPTDEETVSKRSMYPRETIAFDEDSSSRAALMRLQKLGRSSGTGVLGDIPTPTGKVTSDCHERSQNECQQRTNAVIQPSVASLNNAAAHLLDTLQAVKEDVSEPTLSRPVDEIHRAEEQPTNAYGSPVTRSESGDHWGTGEKLTPTRNKLLQAFRQVVAAKNKLSPDSPMKALAKEQPTPQPDSVTTGEPAKKKVIFEISGMASRNGGSTVNGALEVKREDEASRQPPKDALSGGDVVGVDCGDVSQKRKTDACESDDGGSDDNDALTECVANAMVLSQWPLPEAEMDTSEPSTSCAANDQAINKLPSATHHNIGTIPLPSFVGQPTDVVLNALTLSQGPSIAPSLPPVPSVAPSLPEGRSIAPSLPPISLVAPSLPQGRSIAPSLPPISLVAPSLPQGRSIASSLPPISSVAPSLHQGLSIAPSLPPFPSVASSLPLVHSIAPSLPPVPSIAPSLSPVPSVAPSLSPVPSIAPSLSLVPSTTPSLSLVPSIAPSLSPVPSIASSLPVDPSTIPPLPAPPLPPFHTLGPPSHLSTATPLLHDSTNAPPLPPDPITPPPPDPSTAPPLPPPPDPSTAPPPPVVPSPTDEMAKMPWMTGEPSALDHLHLQAMSAFLQQRGATVGTDTPQGEMDTSAYMDLQYPPPYDIAATDQYAYWCQYYYHVNPYIWGWGQWGRYWSHWQQQQLMGGYPSTWTTPPYPQQWTQHQPTYPGQTTGSTRRFLLPTPDTSQPPPWGNTSSYPPTGVPPPAAPALQGGDAEKVHAIDIRSPVLVNKTRMYVLNRNRLVCKSIERFLLFMGAKSLDPFNLRLLPPTPAEVFVLIHKADAHQLHQIPNLLRLKEEEHIQFVIYQDVMDVKHRLYIPILSRGGMLVTDDMALFSVNPDTLLHLVEYLEKQTDGGNPWCLKVHAHMLQQIEKAKLKHHMTSRAYRHLGEVTRILTTHVTVVDILPEHATCIRPHPAHLYFNCCRTLQHQQADTYRHTILLSESTWSDVDVKAFQSSGIGVTSIVDFVKRVTGKTVEPQAVVQRPDFGLRESPLFSDSCRSSAVDTIETLITSTEDVDGHAEDTSEGNDCEKPQRESAESTEAAGSFLHSFVPDRYVAGTE